MTDPLNQGRIAGTKNPQDRYPSGVVEIKETLYMIQPSFFQLLQQAMKFMKSLNIGVLKRQRKSGREWVRFLKIAKIPKGFFVL